MSSLQLSNKDIPRRRDDRYEHDAQNKAQYLPKGHLEPATWYLGLCMDVRFLRPTFQLRHDRERSSRSLSVTSCWADSSAFGQALLEDRGGETQIAPARRLRQHRPSATDVGPRSLHDQYRPIHQTGHSRQTTAPQKS